MRQWKACTNAEKQTKLNSTHKKIGKTFTIVFFPNAVQIKDIYEFQNFRNSLNTIMKT